MKADGTRSSREWVGGAGSGTGAGHRGEDFPLAVGVKMGILSLLLGWEGKDRTSKPGRPLLIPETLWLENNVNVTHGITIITKFLLTAVQ